VNIGAALFLLVQLPELRAVGATYRIGRQPSDAHPTRMPFLSFFHAEGVGQVLRLLGPRIFWAVRLADQHDCNRQPGIDAR